VKLVRHVLAAEGVEAEIHEVLVSDEEMASELDFADLRQSESMVENVTGEARDTRSFRAELPSVSWIEAGRSPPAEMVHLAVLKAR